MFINILANLSVKLSAIALEKFAGFKRKVTEKQRLLSGCFMKSGYNLYGSQQIDKRNKLRIRCISTSISLFVTCNLYFHLGFLLNGTKILKTKHSKTKKLFKTVHPFK